MCPAQSHFISLALMIMSMACVLSVVHMLVFLSLYAMLSILVSISSVRPQVCSVFVWSVSTSMRHICHSRQHAGVVHLSLQAVGKVAFEEIPVLSYAAQSAMIIRVISLS